MTVEIKKIPEWGGSSPTLVRVTKRNDADPAVAGITAGRCGAGV